MGNIYIETDENFRVTKIHRMPFDPNQGMGYTREELEKKGYFVDDVPSPVNQIGRRAIAMYNADTKSIYYEYVGIPMSDKERLEQLEAAMNSVLLLQNQSMKNDFRVAFKMPSAVLVDKTSDTVEIEDEIAKNIGSYLAYQVISGNIEADKCLKLYPQFEYNIKEKLMENGIQV